MPRNGGRNYTVARNRDLPGAKVDAAQGHNERQNEIYSNEDIISEPPRSMSTSKVLLLAISRCLTRWSKPERSPRVV